MNARDKLNIWWIVAVAIGGLIVADAIGSGIVFVIVVIAGLLWANQRGHIR